MKIATQCPEPKGNVAGSIVKLVTHATIVRRGEKLFSLWAAAIAAGRVAAQTTQHTLHCHGNTTNVLSARCFDCELFPLAVVLDREARRMVQTLHHHSR